MTLWKWEITKKKQYNNRILEAVIAHLQDAGHPIAYSKFSSPKNGLQYRQKELCGGTRQTRLTQFFSLSNAAITQEDH